jgi:cytochrome c oxidase subunit 2
MSSSPRSRPSQTTLFAHIVGALLILAVIVGLILGVNVIQYGETFVTGLYPPKAVTEQGAKVRDLYTIVFVIAAAIFLLVEGLIIWTVIRYRRKPDDVTLPPQTHGNNVAEIIWTVVPTLIVIFMFVISWQTLNVVDTTSTPSTTRIRALAGQFQWQFDYLSEDGRTILYTQSLPTASSGGGMYVPAGRTIQLSLASQDVIHAFYVPQFLFKRDVVPGRTNTFEFKVNDTDAGQTFRGQCAELCGTGHAIMLFDVVAKTGPEFDSWLQQQIAQHNATPPPAPSGQASGAPNGSGAPSGGAGGEAGPTVAVTAKNVAYEQTTLTAAANKPFKIDFDNEDAGTPHNVAIHEGSASGKELFKGEIFPGVAKKTYDVPALAAGSYAFVCSVHPNMTGTLTVQ